MSDTSKDPAYRMRIANALRRGLALWCPFVFIGIMASLIMVYISIILLTTRGVVISCVDNT